MATYSGIKKIKIGDNVYELAVDWSNVTNQPTIPTNTDEKLKTAALTSGTTYYPILATGANAAANRQVDSTLGGLKYISTAGTTSAVGTAVLYLGNSTASGTANNEQGVIRLYGTTAYYTDIKAESGLPAANRTIYVPSYAGTMYLTCTSTTDAVGGATTAPVYVDNTGRIQAVTSIPYSLLTGTPTIPTNTDEKVKTIALTSGTTYYPILATGANAAANRQVDSTLGSFKYTVTAGTTSAIGKAFLELGNNIASGTANNVKGILKIYGANSTAYLIDAQSETTASEVTLTLPDAGGTLLSSGCLNYTTSGNNRAVQRDSNGNLYVTQKDDDTTYSAGTGLSLSSTTFSVKTGYTTSGNNRKVQADSSGNLYVVQKDTNTYVTQTGDSTATWRKVLGTYNGASAVTTTVSNATNLAYFDADGPAFNTSTGELYTKGYYMYLATNDALYTAIDGLGWTSEVIS